MDHFDVSHSLTALSRACFLIHVGARNTQDRYVSVLFASPANTIEAGALFGAVQVPFVPKSDNRHLHEELNPLRC